MAWILDTRIAYSNPSMLPRLQIHVHCMYMQVPIICNNTRTWLYIELFLFLCVVKSILFDLGLGCIILDVKLLCSQYYVFNILSLLVNKLLCSLLTNLNEAYKGMLIDTSPWFNLCQWLIVLLKNEKTEKNSIHIEFNYLIASRVFLSY